MQNVEVFKNPDMGTMTIDFTTGMVTLARGAIASTGWHSYTSMAFNFGEISAVEFGSPALSKKVSVCFILRGCRYLNASNQNNSNFTFKTEDTQRATEVILWLIRALRLPGPQKLGAAPAQNLRYEMQYSPAELVQADEDERAEILANAYKESRRETRKQCQVCGHIFCYNNEDIKRNRSNSTKAVFSSIAGIAGAFGGYHAASAMNQSNAQNSLNQIVDYNRCPKCNSTNLIVLADNEYAPPEQSVQTAPAFQPQQTAAIPQQTYSPMDELKKLKELLDMGIITQEEFDLKKKQLLGL